MITNIRPRNPDPRLAFDPRALGLSEPPRAFYWSGTVRVARSLVGAWPAPPLARPLVRRPHRRDRGVSWRGDRAAHSWAGRRTARVEPMYADGGHLYVFLVYGSCTSAQTS
jgi:DNA-3-methyladenine glycosylase